LRLESLHLQNIRSHVKTVVQFGDGFNCLVGGLGQGKSTVLYAYDFVLFGDPLGRSYDYLLRENAEEGKVTAFFVHNSRLYRIERALKRHENGISQDIDQLKFYRDGKLVAGNKNDAVAEQLKALTGLDKNIFREIVWVRQEHLKELLDITPRQRQKKLDQLFGLSDYELAWNGLHQFGREYEVEKNVLERDADVIHACKLEVDYISTVEEFSLVTSKLEDSKKKVIEAESALNEASIILKGLEELRKTTEMLQRREVQLQTNIGNINYMIRKLADQAEGDKRRLDDFEKYLEKTEEQKNSHRDVLLEIGLGADTTFEDARTYIFALEDQLRNIGGEQEATKRELGTSLKRFSNLINENKCPTCFQDITGDYKKNLAENLQKERTEREKRLKELQQSYDQIKDIHYRVKLAFSNLQQLIPRIEDLKKQVSEKQESIVKISVERREKQEEEKTLQKQLKETREEINNFDVAQLESARNLQKRAFTDHFEARHEMDNLENRKTNLALRVDDLKERLDNTQKKIDRKEKIVMLLEIIDRIRGAYRSIQPKLRSEFVSYLQRTVQQVLDRLTGDVGPALFVRIDETYSPFVSSEEGYEREVSNLSGGERTLVAFAYRIGLGQLIMHSRTGHGLFMLLLDEPTESLGREDGSVERLAEAISRLKAIEQIIAVTHNESFAEKAEHVIRIEKEAGASQVFNEK
jgi:exonuclease SbcC